MEPTARNLVLPMILLVLLSAACGPGLGLSRRIAYFMAAAALLGLSGFFFHTLIVDECCLERDLNGTVEDVALIGAPALAGIILAAVGIRLPRKP
jgi:hypothetical protein